MHEEAWQLKTQIDSTTTDHAGSHRRGIILECAFVMLLIAGAFVVCIWGLSKMHFWDENVYLQNAEQICCGKSNYSEIDKRPPLLSILFAGAFLLWHNDYAAAIITALLNALGPAFLYLGGRKCVGKIPAAIASLLLAFVPFFANASHTLLADCPALSLILFSFWLLFRALQKQTDLRFACAGMGLALSVLMRFGSLSSVGILSLLVLAADRRFRAALACSVGFAAVVGPYLCWSRVRYGGFLATFVNGWLNFGGPTEPFFYYIRNSAVVLSWITIAGLVLWIVRWLWKIRRQDEEGYRSIPCERCLVQNSRPWEGFLCLWACATLIYFSAMSHKELRYAIPVAPPLFLLAGIGLSTLLKGRKTVARIAGTACLIGALSYGLWPVRHRFESGFIDHSVSEEMEVSDFLNRCVPPSTVLYTNMNYPDFAYYTTLKVNDLPEDSRDLNESLKHLPSDGILIVYHEDVADVPAEPTLDFLDSDPHFRRVREFPSLELYEYSASGERSKPGSTLCTSVAQGMQGGN
jgi:4-amino-4-deoxy-L-arabinose transferase-like glycosyltransferase